MSELDSERSKAWNIYSGSEANNNNAATDQNQAAPWKNFGTSMNAISFGFVATAVLISMFVIMAIFEHLFKPNASLPSSSQDGSNRPQESRQMQKLGHPHLAAATTYSSDFSVLMPGQRYPTYIAQPAPLPCPREGAHWPSHEHTGSIPP